MTTPYRHPQHWTLQDSLFIAACAVLLPVLLWPFVKFLAYEPGVPLWLAMGCRWLVSVVA